MILTCNIENNEQQWEEKQNNNKGQAYVLLELRKTL